MVLEIFRQKEINVYVANIFTPGLNALAYVIIIEIQDRVRQIETTGLVYIYIYIYIKSSIQGLKIAF